MKVSAISNTTPKTVNRPCKPTQRSFKGVITAEAIERAKFPTTAIDWQQKFAELLEAVVKEPSANIKEINVINKLLRESKSLDSLNDFVKNSINFLLASGQRKSLINESGKDLLIIGRDCGVRGYNTNLIQVAEGYNYAQFGVADIYNGALKLNFYKDNDLYIDFYNNGGIRKFAPAIQTAMYFKPTGERDYFGGVKDFFNSF